MNMIEQRLLSRVRHITLGAPGSETRAKYVLSGRRLLLCLFILRCAMGASGQLLDYGTFSGYGLGKGILGNDYTTPLAACITGTEHVLAASHANVRVSIVYSADEYKKAFHIDQQAQASFLGMYGGSDELHFGQENAVSSSAFDIVVEAYGEHDGKTVDNVRWDPPYDKFIASGTSADIQRVRDSCGDRYIQTVFNETRLFAVLHVSKQQNSSLTTFSGKMAGQADIDVVSASGALGGDSNVSSANKAGAIAISIYSEGLGGVIPTAGALSIANTDGLQDIAGKLAAYLSTLHDTGQPVKYQLSRYPGMPTGNLSDQRIFGYLNDLKSNYFSTSFRLDNLNSLLRPGDPRRTILSQPQADTNIRKQLALLTTYQDSVATAHDKCRKALSLGDCEKSATGLQMPPARVKAELAPIVQPIVASYIFAIDGTPVPPGQASRLFATPGDTVLGAARSIRAGAANVDLMAAIFNSEYISQIDIPAVAPQAPPYSPIGVGGTRLVAEDLRWPSYWKDVERPNSVLHVLHADEEHPCKISVSGGLNFIDESCLTSVGMILRAIAVEDVAQHVISRPPTTYDFTLNGVITNCFGAVSVSPVANVHLTMNPSSVPNEVATRIGLFLPLGPLSIPLIEQDESHDAAIWNQLALSRLAALPRSGNALPATDPCGANVQ